MTDLYLEPGKPTSGDFIFRRPDLTQAGRGLGAFPAEGCLTASIPCGEIFTRTRTDWSSLQQLQGATRGTTSEFISSSFPRFVPDLHQEHAKSQKPRRQRAGPQKYKMDSLNLLFLKKHMNCQKAVRIFDSVGDHYGINLDANVKPSMTKGGNTGSSIRKHIT